MTIRTKKQALAEAAKRWGKTAGVKDDGSSTLNHFKVGRVELGLFFAVRGSGRTWELAFLHATRSAVKDHRDYVVRVAATAGGLQRLAGEFRRSGEPTTPEAAEKALADVEREIAEREAKLPPAPPACWCDTIVGVTTAPCGKALCADHVREHQRRRPGSSGYCAKCAEAQAVQP